MHNWLTAESKNSLEENEVHIWLAHLDISPSRIKQYYPTLSAEEKQRSERFIQYTQRKRFIASHGFMRAALASYFSLSAKELIFEKEEKGKPYLELDNKKHPIHFNLSHSHHLAVLAICKNKPVGIDIEYMGRKNEWKKIIQRFFTQNEQQKLFSLPETEQQQAFFKVWTRKEAHMKVLGEGLHLAPNQFSVSVPPQAAKFIAYENKILENECFMQQITPQKIFSDYCICLSVEGRFNTLKKFVFP